MPAAAEAGVANATAGTTVSVGGLTITFAKATAELPAISSAITRIVCMPGAVGVHMQVYGGAEHVLQLVQQGLELAAEVVLLGGFGGGPRERGRGGGERGGEAEGVVDRGPVEVPGCGFQRSRTVISGGSRTAFQRDGGRAQRARVPGIIVAQVSGISLRASELSTLASIAGVGNSAPKAMVFAPSTMQTCPRRRASLATNAFWKREHPSLAGTWGSPFGKAPR